MGPRAELDLNQNAVSHSVAWCGIPTGPRGVSGREERSAADRRRVLAQWRPAPGGGKRSDEARPSLRACVPFRIARARRRPGARIALRAASLFYRTAKAGAFFPA